MLDCRQPIVAFADFYNEPLSDVVEMDRDFAYFAAASESPTPAYPGATKISFMNFPFILTPAAKALGLYYDNRIRMYSERRMSLFHSVVHGQPSNPYLKVMDELFSFKLARLDLKLSLLFPVESAPRSRDRRRSHRFGNGGHGKSVGFEEAAGGGV